MPVRTCLVGVALAVCALLCCAGAPIASAQPAGAHGPRPILQRQLSDRNGAYAQGHASGSAAARFALTQFSLGQEGTDSVALHLANGLPEQADVHLIMAMHGGVGQQALESIDVHKANVHYLLQRKPASRVLGQIIAVPLLMRKLRPVLAV